MNKKLQKVELDAAIVKALVEDAHKSYLQLAGAFGVGINYLVGVVKKNGLGRRRGRGSPAWQAKKQREAR